MSTGAGRARRLAQAAATAVVVGGLVMLSGCDDGSRSATPVVADAAGEALVSPSGGLTATLVAGKPENGVETLVVAVTATGPAADAPTGSEVFRSQRQYSGRHGVRIVWQDQEDVLWALSSDVGTSRIGRDGGRWSQTWMTPETLDQIPPEINALR